MAKLYERVNWEDLPSKNTPINAENLNKMDEAIDKLDDKIVELEEGGGSGSGADVEYLEKEIGELENLSTNFKENLVGAVNEVFQSVSNGKSLIASAITDMGVETASDATFAQMADNITLINNAENCISDTEWVYEYAKSKGYTYWWAWIARNTKEYRIFLCNSKPVFTIDISIARSILDATFRLSTTIKAIKQQKLYLSDENYTSCSSIKDISFKDSTYDYYSLPEDLSNYHPSYKKIVKNMWHRPDVVLTPKEILNVTNAVENITGVCISKWNEDVEVLFFVDGFFPYFDLTNREFIYGPKLKSYLNVLPLKEHISLELTLNSYTYGSSYFETLLSNIETEVYFNSEPLCDENGNVLLEANCTIEDFI